MISKKALKFQTIAAIRLVSTTKKSLLDYLIGSIDSKKKVMLFTPNPEFVVYASRHSWFRDILTQSDINIPDGVGLALAGKVLRKPLKTRITGVDLMIDLCREAGKRGWSAYFLGGKPGAAKASILKLKKVFGDFKAWSSHGPSLKLNGVSGELSPLVEIERAVKEINEKKPDLLFVAFGMGKQEKFITDNFKRLDVRLAVGVGGSFDYISGKTKRAPLLIRKAGLEWLFRLTKEPWRLKRQLKLLEFVFLVLKERINPE
ncbi:MAG: WecB/TagA/CpsF family glycosyltransferase [Patescibacteria group bacterium]